MNWYDDEERVKLMAYIICSKNYKKENLNNEIKSNLVIKKEKLKMNNIINIPNKSNVHDASKLFNEIETADNNLEKFEESSNIYGKTKNGKQIFSETIYESNYLPIKAHYLYSTKSTWNLIIWIRKEELINKENFADVYLWLAHTN